MAVKLTQKELNALRSGKNTGGSSRRALTVNGVNYGNVSQNGYNAYLLGNLRSYKPADEEEKNTINAYLKAVNAVITGSSGGEKTDYGECSRKTATRRTVCTKRRTIICTPTLRGRTHMTR